MKILNLNRFLLLLMLAFSLFSCDDDDEDLMGNWSELSDFDGLPRCDAVGFSIGNSGYIGTGYDGDDRLYDFWEYNPDLNYWTQKADFPGTARNGAVGFSIGNRGYIGTGYDGENNLNDFWEYNPDNDSWIKIADFPGSARYGAVAFSIGNKGYVGTGYDGNYLKDFYEYDPSSNNWTKIISIGGSKRRDANAFVIDNKAYVVSGLDNGVYENDVWMFDPTTGLWTEKNDITDTSDDDYDDDYSSIARINAVGISFDGKGYLVGGSTGALVNNVWEYDPQSDVWEERTLFEGSSRTEAVGFTINSEAYITTGRSSSYYFDDIWTFDPTVEYDEDN